MKLKRLLSLGLVCISALTGAFMLTGCGDKEETKPAEVKRLDAVIASAGEQDFTATIEMTMSGTDGEGSYTGYLKNDQDNQVVMLDLMEEQIYAWMNDGKSYWASDVLEWFFEDDCIYANGSKAFDLAKHPSMIIMYDNTFWKGGADISEVEDLDGNTCITSTNTIKQSGVSSGMVYDSTIELETTFKYKDGLIVSIYQNAHFISTTEWNGETEEFEATEIIECTFDYSDVTLEVPADIKALEEDATKVDVDKIKTMMQAMSSSM